MTHRFDRPEKPKVRTKVCELPDDVDAAYFELILNYADGDIDTDTYLDQCVALFHGSVMGEKFDPLKQIALHQRGQFELLRRHINEKRYTVLYYMVEENEVHAPHHHHNVASTQILVEGQLQLREYDRVKRDDDGTLIARQTSERVLKPGDTFQASEWKNNIHWFQAVDGPALIFNTNARGFEKRTFETEANRFGRLYVDPTAAPVNGDIACEEFDSDEAYRRFGGKPLGIFSNPNFADK